MNLDSKPTKEKTVRKPNKHQQIIGKFVTIQKSRSFWPNEMKIAGQLMEKYNFDFLIWCPKPNGYTVYSLVWFLTEQGKHFLSDQLLEYAKQKDGNYARQEITLDESKVGEDLKISNKPKTLKEFLNI